MDKLHSYLRFSTEVQLALQQQQAVVALESTVISHGLPYPDNLEVARAMEAIIRAEGACPATIAVHDGQILVGLQEDELYHLAQAQDGIQKVSRRDLAVTLAQGGWGATTVAGTMLCANLAGIRFFATGGIGGVHQGATTSMDISADLQELSRTPVAVICAGAKSILDLRLTLEYLETYGVPVLGWQTADFPAFYVASSGYPVSHSVSDLDALAQIIRTQWQCGLGGLLVTCPIPEAYALSAEDLERHITAALEQAELKEIRGAALTPFVLATVASSTAGASLVANKALLLNNALWAARFARTYYQSKDVALF
ncbi:pseudouridine-5'-phosphate glycosidase [Tengunoibacter tsumagoiensis]|uniref:Pseudouridine-5'-phosphate glycosidase n=1 Tax=Tengunoibacter tsumagoiensis TaxID=2014871 RepID=A0A401ZTQ6_9CHLR|nr:pseudouridine-5'-phosphate glycosidase [Tengunoibacter tsumagoiensis]GCE10251.1 pseudouridine-5'-phosphate glycosidase [Tengunoibacter tsumagoiensis]